MLELTVAAAGHHEYPPVPFQQADYFTYLHLITLTDTLNPVPDQGCTTTLPRPTRWRCAAGAKCPSAPPPCWAARSELPVDSRVLPMLGRRFE
jgi:hypothetical protein